jgi:O-antigen ligase
MKQLSSGLPIHRRFPSISVILLGVLVTGLWLAGGAARPDAPAQVVIRALSLLIMVLAIGLGPRGQMDGLKSAGMILVAVTAIAMAQLVPLPPKVWMALPGRIFIEPAASLLNEQQPWRPLTLVPGATVNTLSSLLAPVSLIVLLSQIRSEDRRLIPVILLVLAELSTLTGLLQFAGISTPTLLSDGEPGSVSGFFANRNHFALLAAIGTLLSIALLTTAPTRWRTKAMLLATALVTLNVLAGLACGSRSGVILGILAIMLGGALVVAEPTNKRVDPKTRAIFMGTALIATALAVVLASGRAVSIDRFMAGSLRADIRVLAVPEVFAVTRQSFPVGSGFGSFAKVFEVTEPDRLLSPYYLNHAHNDYIELVSDTGLLGLLLICFGITFFAYRCFTTWVRDTGTSSARLGSSIIALVALASLVDYPIRTPILMCVALAAWSWLSGFGENQVLRRRKSDPVNFAA